MNEALSEIGSIVITLLPIALLILLWSLLPAKGARGEKRVASILRKLPEDSYKIINNLLIANKGRTSQIDHVVISVYGIFVIETKTYKGWIYGGEHSDCWTQNIYGHKYQLPNPIYQNYGHIKTLKNILTEYLEIPYISIVAFSPQARLGITSNTPVIYWNQILQVINQFENRVLAIGQVLNINALLLAANIDSKANRREHIKAIRTNVRKRNAMIASGKCPRCGGILILRQGKYGSFYGCSNYPGCKYTSN